MVNPTGYTALDFIGFTDKGTYAANVNYVKNDLVHYGGNIWRVLVDDTIGITPAEGTSYTLFIGEPTNLVERIIAPLEDNPATVAYAKGRQIIYNDYLYEVVKNIAVGDTLVAYEDDPTNANIKLASPVETQVLALKADKVNKSDVVNNVTTTTAGKVLDARQGKALQDGINAKVNKSDIANNVTTTAEGKVLDARQGKALQDGINAKVNKSDIANNVTTTAEGKVLDARQGKALQDKINKHFFIDRTSTPLSFSTVGNAVQATVSDARVTANSFIYACFTNACIQAAANANVVVDSASGSIVFTADSTPSNDLYCLIEVTNP
jgi:hypothetical protein